MVRSSDFASTLGKVSGGRRQEAGFAHQDTFYPRKLSSDPKPFFGSGLLGRSIGYADASALRTE
jgi:hypothetical protein